MDLFFNNDALETRGGVYSTHSMYAADKPLCWLFVWFIGLLSDSKVPHALSKDFKLIWNVPSISASQIGKTLETKVDWINWRLLDIMQQEFDFVIIGGGTAGLVVANRLTENPDIQVLVLEAGENHIEDLHVKDSSAFGASFGTEADWAFQSGPQVGPPPALSSQAYNVDLFK